MMQSGEKQLYTGFADCCRTIARKEGYAGFYKGLVPNLVRGIGGSVVLVVYDELQKIVRQWLKNPFSIITMKRMHLI